MSAQVVDVDVVGGEVVEQRREVGAGDIRAPALLDRREPLGEREGARIEHRQQAADEPVAVHVVLAVRIASISLQVAELGDQVLDALRLHRARAAGCGPRDTIAATAVRPRARAGPRARRGRRTAARSRAAGAGARRRTPRPRSARRCAARPLARDPLVVEPALGEAGVAGDQEAVLGERLAVGRTGCAPGRGSCRGGRAASRCRGASIERQRGARRRCSAISRSSSLTVK